MRTAAQVFYLAVFGLLGSSHGASHATASTKEVPANVCEFEPKAIVSDACASYSTLEQLNDAIHPYLHSLTQKTDFFSHYRLSLYDKKCPFWDDENGMCGNRACAVNTLDNEEDIPTVWRAKALGKLEGPTAQHPGKKQQREHKQRPLHGSLGENVDESCVVEYDDECDERDYCIPEDESATAKGNYVSLVDNPERFTGYAGAGAQQVWEAIYRENCFNKDSTDSPSAAPSSPLGGLSSKGFPNHQQLAANQLRNVLKQQGLKQNVKSAIAEGTPRSQLDPVEFDDTCLEKRVFHRVISGMHASINTHLCWDYLDQKTGEWGPNLTCYEQRLHHYPERVSNIYFNYALVMRAVGKIKQHVQDYSFCSEDPEQDTRTKNMVLRLANAIPSGPEIFDETVMFQDPDKIALKEDFRNRFRNVSRIMDCVGCDKCRLWGKLQTNGYGTALKVLFEFDEHDSSKDPPLRRIELVALLNTMDRLSHSMQVLKEFRRMVDERDGTSHLSSQTPTPEDEVLKTKRLLDEPEKIGSESEWPKFERDWDSTNMTILDEFKAEFDLVWRAYKYVMTSWWHMPGKLAKIGLMELNRLWNYYLGNVVPERSWKIHIPTHEEL